MLAPSRAPQLSAGEYLPNSKMLSYLSGGTRLGRRAFLASDPTTGRMVVVKRMSAYARPRNGAEVEITVVVENLKANVSTLMALSHPHIVQFLAHHEAPETVTMLYEYVPGRSIASAVRRYGAFSGNTVKSFTRQTLGALEYLHSEGIIHGDLTSDNVLVDMNGVCKISNLNFSSATYGSVFWMAPEIVRLKLGSWDYRPEANVWSVGCLIVEMLSGATPWFGMDPLVAAFELYSGKAPHPPPRAKLPGAASVLTKLCFLSSPNSRPSAAELRGHRYLQPSKHWNFQGFTRRDRTLESLIAICNEVSSQQPQRR